MIAERNKNKKKHVDGGGWGGGVEGGCDSGDGEVVVVVECEGKKIWQR